MNRRSFLASLIATATLDPERLLWVPGKKDFSFPIYTGVGRPGEHRVALYYLGHNGIYEVRFDDPVAVKITQAFIGNHSETDRYVWPMEEITLAEFKRRYPDSSLKI